MIDLKKLSKPVVMFLFLVIFFNTGCQENTNAVYNLTTSYQQYDLVADATIFPATRVDPTLLNGWGIVVDASGSIYIASNHSGTINVYNVSGASTGNTITVPSNTGTTGGAPSGIVLNNTTDFVIPLTGITSKLLIASEDGTISAWATGNAAIKVIDRSSFNAVYKGIAIGNFQNQNYIYAANFKGKTVDVFDKNFNYVSTMPFSDPTMPADFGPFNIKNINGSLYIAYAKPKPPDFVDDTSGAGNGYVNVFDTQGNFIKRWASKGVLNSPWGIEATSSGFGDFSNSILISNFGDGTINIYDLNGNYQGKLLNKSNLVLSIDGLWGMAYVGDNSTFGGSDQLFFTAGPMHELHGLFGYLK
jgi:uncharacterized protein (TIGR03118 family)